jgi:cobalt-precorrin-5B (C1)-methyltransferase
METFKPEFIIPPAKALKTGVTTGLCAAAAAKAATMTLLSPNAVRHITVKTKTGVLINFDVTDTLRENGIAKCAVKKDAGDDPDITNGLKVFAAVSKTSTKGIEIDGGDGIGRITKPGLRVAPGKAAINPVPMEMVNSAITEACALFSYTGGIKVIISIPGGAAIAKKTMNERLGIIGGLSILGTTGIVEPMSDRAIIETIKAEIDVQTASGKTSLIITPGKYGYEFAEKTLGINMEEAIKCSNFIGETLDYACVKGIEKITLIGHAGKLVKLAGGIMNTHSNVADCRMEIISAHCALAGADTRTVKQIMDSVSVEAAMKVMDEVGLNDRVWKNIGQKIGFHLRERVRGSIVVEYIVFNLERGVLIHSDTGKN